MLAGYFNAQPISLRFSNTLHMDFLALPDGLDVAWLRNSVGSPWTIDSYPRLSYPLRCGL